MALEVRELTLEMQKKCTEAVVGQVTCPYCGQGDIKVINHDSKGNRTFSYLENHDISNDSGDSCRGSGKPLRHFD